MGTLVGRHGVGLGDDRDDVDFLVQSLHELNVERLEAVAGRRDKVQAAVNSRVGLARFAVDTGLRVQVLFISEQTKLRFTNNLEGLKSPLSFALTPKWTSTATVKMWGVGVGGIKLNHIHRLIYRKISL